MNRNNNFNSVRRLSMGIILFNFLIIASFIILGAGFLLFQLISNPESIGEWFGRLVSGFKSQ